MIVQRFLHWLETAPKSSRADAAAALARASLSEEMPGHEKEAAEAALTLLLDDPSLKVRLAMADALASDAATPRHLIMALAQDQAEIAMLVLCRSPVFLDSELIEIVANGDPVTLMAIACRQPLSNVVVGAIVDADNFEACLALLHNSSAKLAAEDLRAIARQKGKSAEIREALLQQHNLPAEIRQTLIASLSEALQDLVVEKSWLNEARAEKVVQGARDRATEQLASEIAVQDIAPLVDHLRHSGQLTTAFLVRTVCGGNIPLFIAAIASLSNIPAKRITAVLHQGRTAAFRAIYDRTGLPESALPAFTAAVDIWRDQPEDAAIRNDVQVRRQAIERIVAFYKASVGRHDDQLLALLQRISTEAVREAALMRAREISSAA